MLHRGKKPEQHRNWNQKQEKKRTNKNKPQNMFFLTRPIPFINYARISLFIEVLRFKSKKKRIFPYDSKSNVVRIDSAKWTEREDKTKEKTNWFHFILFCFFFFVLASLAGFRFETQIKSNEMNSGRTIDILRMMRKKGKERKTHSVTCLCVWVFFAWNFFYLRSIEKWKSTFSTSMCMVLLLLCIFCIRI